ncbi:sulfite exporter TauE/SafE family protein [Pyrobaculum calidifontis]|uniref:sulfite exporter TauE/SafE family protein n=1 Tax=Pyrobaculum calidifontis TaxID=181486 RepID=UPI000324782B|nr:sulfite exporter TauE/SafE family protein [Pyrobaculum calidifontis]
MQITLSAVSGLFVGFSLGLIGGGGSILAVPLLLYFVGLQEVPDAVHIAVGSTAMAVGLNALINSIYHLRRRNLSARVGTLFATFGVLGSTVGAYVGHLTSGTVLLAAFAVAMVAIGLSMFLQRKRRQRPRRLLHVAL